ncbi:uncharacterized protein [Nicotiana sylvestris]|uniref:uncharacterized protein n=1 Tax=Nicotiana sylvestris TaxID=4096 RepID=UPI00388C5402
MELWKEHRHILETSWAIRFQDHLPVIYWGHCINIAVYIINKKFPSALAYKSLYELLPAEGTSESFFLDISPVPRHDFTMKSIDNPSFSEHRNAKVPTVSPDVPSVVEIRKSTRVSKPSIWLKDYVRPDKLGSVSCCKYPISKVIGYEAISPKYQSYLANFSIEVEPTTYSKATKDKRWIEAMQTEIKALEDNKNWELASLPQGQKTIRCKWQSYLDYFPFIKRKTDHMVIVLVYVDDLLIIGDSLVLIQQTKDDLQSSFKIKDLGELKYFLGIEFARNGDGILMHQRKYTLELIVELGLSGSKPVACPIEPNLKLTTSKFDN